MGSLTIFVYELVSFKIKYTIIMERREFVEGTSYLVAILQNLKEFYIRYSFIIF